MDGRRLIGGEWDLYGFQGLNRPAKLKEHQIDKPLLRGHAAETPVRFLESVASVQMNVGRLEDRSTTQPRNKNCIGQRQDLRDDQGYHRRGRGPDILYSHKRHSVIRRRIFEAEA